MTKRAKIKANDLQTTASAALSEAPVTDAEFDVATGGGVIQQFSAAQTTTGIALLLPAIQWAR
jgi:hypothetical protein